jgi:hypothetical protein
MPLPVLAWPAIWAFLSAIIAPVTRAVITALGVSLVVFAGLEIAFDQMYDHLYGSLASLPDIGLYVIKASGFMTCINMWVAATAAYITFQSISGGAKMLWKKPL